MLSRKTFDNQLLKIAAENPPMKTSSEIIPTTNSFKCKEGIAEDPISA